MKIESIQVGESINIKKFLDEFKIKHYSKDPHVIEWSKKSHLVIFRYGTIVLWNFEDEEKRNLIKKIQPFVVKPLSEPLTETAKWEEGKEPKARDGIIQSQKLDTESIRLISVTLARSSVLDHFENKVEKLLIQSNTQITKFTESGQASVRGKNLLKMAGAAMMINSQTVTQMAMLDKPDFLWDDPYLDSLFEVLEEEYEISSRYKILTKKLAILIQDSEFIMNYLDSRRGTLLEIMIVALFVIDIVLILIQDLH